MATSSSPTTAAAAANYKKLKEDFVSNLSGGSVGEIFLVTAIAPIAVLAWSVLQRRQAFFRPYSSLAFVVDALLNVGAILLAITLYSGQPLLLNGLLLAQTLFVLALPRNAGGRPRRVAKKPKAPLGQAKAGSSSSTTSPAVSATSAQRHNDLPRKAFLTTYRGCMMVVTCLGILAVDFRIFPRRFAKVETWGTSLMDIGVGSFVFSAGIVAARPLLKERATGRVTPLGRRLLTSVRHSLPLLALGVVRLLSVKGLDYAEHVSEYGVHWNFFFTLGLLPPFVALSQSALRIVPSYAVLAVLLVGAYQVALEATDLKAYILTAPRIDLLSKNREGLFSFVGYLAIFLAGQDTGLYLLPRSSTGSSSETSRQPASLTTSAWLGKVLSANRLPVWAALWTVLHLLSVGFPYGLGLTESRRLANLPYVLWVLSFNTVQLTMFYLVDQCVFSPPSEAAANPGGGEPAVDDAAAAAGAAQAEAAAAEENTSTVLRAYNRNGLPVFLVANLLTGLVNLTVPTLDVGPAVSMGILVAYGGCLTALVVALDAYNITIKL